MEINKKVEDNKLFVSLIGRLDSNTSVDLEKDLQADLDNIQEITFDFKDLEYISSAGLRVLLMCQKKIASKGKMEVINVNETIKEIFEITGFSNILDVK